MTTATIPDPVSYAERAPASFDPRIFRTPPPPRRGDPTGQPCGICGGPLAYHTWMLCQCCRDDLQRKADAAVERLRRERPDWYQ